MQESPASPPLAEYREIWKAKPALRAVYDDFYLRIATACRPGLTIEVGGGIGSLKERVEAVIATDIQPAPWLDCVADAQRLPFANASAANIVMVDVLHHLEFPVTFFREAARVLKPCGRVLMIEPAITWGSSGFYRLFHHEPVRTSARALTEGTPHPGRDPYASNQASCFQSFGSPGSNGSRLRPIRSAAASSRGASLTRHSRGCCCASSARSSPCWVVCWAFA